MSEGFVFLPRALIKHQAELNLSSGAVLVLLNLIASWWHEADHPYPRATTIAKRMGINVRTVHRHLNELEEAGYISRVKGHGNGRNARVTVTRYDLSGTVEKLQKVAVPNGARVKNVVESAAVPPQAS